VVFVERGMQLLKKNGLLGYILPHKFFNAKYGQPLRSLLAQAKYLQHIVHFGHQQVFEKATTYTCLLFLNKSGCKTLMFEKVDDLNNWRLTGQSEGQEILMEEITEAAWNLVVGDGTNLFEKLKSMPITLDSVTDRIFQGLKTGADKIFIVDEITFENNLMKIFSPEKGAEYWVEPDLFHPLIKGGDSKSYRLEKTTRRILFPYQQQQNSRSQLIPEPKFKESYPLTWAYLIENKRYLENREKGKFKGHGWYSYSRNQALAVIPLPKIFTPDIVPEVSFSLDKEGDVFFTGGAAGGYGILVSSVYSREYILGLLNSKVTNWFLQQSSTKMRGGWFSCEARFIKHLPIRTIDSSDTADVARHDRMVALVEQMLDLNKRLQAAKAPHERDVLAGMIDATDRQIDRLVYELYGLSEEEVAIVESSGST